MDKLLTLNQLAERWQVTPRTIQNYLASGKLTKVETLDVIRFNANYIQALEMQTGEPKTFKEVQLEKENERLRLENSKLSGIIGKAVGELTGVWRG